MPAQRTDIDPVIGLLRGDGRHFRGLYYLWEQQQWEATQLDLEVDALSWGSIDPVLERAMADATEWLLRRAHVATGALVAFVDAAPTEEQQVFLTTQLVDEARHLVFLDRYGTEVIGRGELTELEEAPASDDGVLLQVQAAAGELRESPAGLTEALGLYQIGTVGAAGLTMIGCLRDALEARGELPGWRSAAELMARDAHRHLAFALHAAGQHPDGRGALRSGSDRAWPGVRELLEGFAAAAPLAGSEELVERARGYVARWVDAVSDGGEG